MKLWLGIFCFTLVACLWIAFGYGDPLKKFEGWTGSIIFSALIATGVWGVVTGIVGLFGSF